MSNRLFLLFLTGCMAIFYSCEYEPTDVFERKIIDNPDEPVVESVNLDLNVDTIYMRYSSYFMYDFSSNNQINAVRFTLDGDEVYLGNSACTAFYMGGKLTNTGTHTLVAEVSVGSGSNSIADVVGAEGSVMTKTWILKMNNKYSSQTDAKAVDGYLNITWPKYTGDDFIDYAIYRDFGPTLTLIKRQTTEGYIDQSYVGEGDRYYIKVNRQQQGELQWGEIYLQSEIPKARLIVGEDNQYYFAWNKSKYYRAVDTYKVIDNNNHSGSNVVKTTQDANDTTYHITSAFFGENVYYKLQLVPGANNPNYVPSAYNQYYSDNYWGTLGYPLKYANEGNLYTFRQVSADEFIYLQDDDTIIRYSTALKKKVEKKSTRYCPGSYNMSVNVTSRYDYLYLYYLCDHTLKLLNPANFNESVTYNISQFAPFNGEPVISDNNLLVANKGYGYTSTVYDLKTQQILGIYNSQSSGYTSKCSSISSDGKYLFLTDNSFRLLKFEAPKFTQVWVNPGPTYNPPKYAAFHALNPEQLAYWDGQTFYIKQCNDFSTVYDFPLTDSSILNIDYYNGKMLCYSRGHLMVRSLLNGDLIKDIPINFFADAITERCYLFNNVIVCEKGFMYFLN